MACVALTGSGMRTFKRALLERHPDVKSAHLTETIARVCGFRTHAALLAAIAVEWDDYVLLDGRIFHAGLEVLTGHAPVCGKK